MTRILTNPQRSALQRAFACNGEAWAPDIPQSILNECIGLGLLRKDARLKVWITDAGKAALGATP